MPRRYNNSSRGKKNSRRTTRVNRNKRLQLKVGESWEERLRVKTEHHNSLFKDRVNGLFAVSFVVLLFALTTYAMVTNDGSMLADVMIIDKVGLVSVAIWATGKAALKVLSGWKDQS